MSTFGGSWNALSFRSVVVVEFVKMRRSFLLFLGVLLNHEVVVVADSYVAARIASFRNEAQYFTDTDRLDRQGHQPTVGRKLYGNYWVMTHSTGEATLQFYDRNEKKGGSYLLGPDSSVRIRGPLSKLGVALCLLKGRFRYFSREKDRSVEICTEHGTVIADGTEILVASDESEARIAVFEGSVSFDAGTDLEPVHWPNGVILRRGQTPEPVPRMAENIVQWWLYYPAVLNLDDLEFSEHEGQSWAASLKRFRRGDLPEAIRLFPGYPAAPDSISDAGRVYLASLLLAAGQSEEAALQLDRLRVESSPAKALRWVIAAVNGDVELEPEVNTSASEWLGLSYYFQARRELDRAQNAAEKSVEMAADFALGWARLAELQFSSGDHREAEQSLHRSLALAPENSQAHALKGFVLAAAGERDAAYAAFQSSMALDSTFGGAWLGRGLLKIRDGDLDAGLNDIELAVALEPDHSLFRSYYGKAFFELGDSEFALKELEIALGLDQNDPTPFLYRALMRRRQNRINEAVGDLERSIRLNDNRALYRSRSLLDQDSSVRSANLANIFHDAGLTSLSLRESAVAVAADYLNPSAHLFVADTFNQLRDPTRVSVRHESVWFNELLLANLLAPVGATSLSRQISQQEYSGMFREYGYGFQTTSSVRTDGRLFQQFSQFGSFSKSAYSVDGVYLHEDGPFQNDEVSRFELYGTLKEQLTSSDSLLFMAKVQDAQSGDIRRFPNPATAPRDLEFEWSEEQSPGLLLAGHVHDFHSESKLLMTFARLANRLSVRGQPEFHVVQVVEKESDMKKGTIEDINLAVADSRASNLSHDYEMFSGDISHVYSWRGNTLVSGVQTQVGTQSTVDRLIPANTLLTNPEFLESPREINERLGRFSGYVYHTTKLAKSLWIHTGITYDRFRYPLNLRRPPISPGRGGGNRFSPKTGFVWRPSTRTTLRGIYSESIGGYSFDQSVRLEPTQLAGFPQSFRGLVPESHVGALEAPRYKVSRLAYDISLDEGTYLRFEVGSSEANGEQIQGAFEEITGNRYREAIQTKVDWDYLERAVSVGLVHRMGRSLTAGLSYEIKTSELTQDSTSLGKESAGEQFALSRPRARMGHLRQFSMWNCQSGWFFRQELDWVHQRYREQTDVASDSVPFLNCFVGYRFPQQKAQITIGALNITDEEYSLSPLNYYPRFPRRQAWECSLTLRF